MVDERNLKWPLLPDHISRGAEWGNDNIRLSDLTGMGIISNEFLKGLLTQIASLLKNPVTILEFPLESHKEPVRTDATSIVFDLRPPCKALRDCSHKYCHKNDLIHAGLLHKPFKGKIETELEAELNRRTRAPEYTGKIKELYGCEAEVRVKNQNGRFFIEYDCLILGYRELLFPIIIDEKIIGAFFLGELVLEEQLPQIAKRRAVFIDRNRTDFTEAEINDIVVAENKWTLNKNNVFTNEAYNKLIADAVERIDGLEARLKHELDVQRKSFTTRRIDAYIRKMRGDLNKPLPEGNEGLRRFWRKVEDVLEDVRNDFPAKHIAIFAQDKYRKEKPKVLDMVASGGLPRRSYKNYTYDLTQISRFPQDIIVSKAEEDLFKGLQGQETDPCKDLIRIFRSPLSSQNLFVIWVHYDNDTWPRLIDEPADRDEIFNQAIVSFYTFISSLYSSLLANFANIIIEKTIRVLGHETGQITSGLDSIRKEILTSPERLRRYRDDEIDLFNHDVQDMLRQLDFLSKSVKSLYSKLPIPGKKEHSVQKDILQKWKHRFRMELYKKKLNIIIEHGSHNDRLSVDLHLLDQIIFNLVNNAVKYCCRGTNIRISCKKDKDYPLGPYFLTVTNYGNKEILDEEKESIFDLFERGKNVEGLEGFGIGLYVAREFARAFGGDIDVTCEEVAQLNVPVLEAFVGKCKVLKEKLNVGNSFLNQVQGQLKTLKESGYYWKIIAGDLHSKRHYYSPTRGQIQESIKKPTFEVTFRVTIPL